VSALLEFYTPGRASNEAAFLYQLFGRQYGTHNFPDYSNMCHEATSVGLPMSIGIGKGTVRREEVSLSSGQIQGEEPFAAAPRVAP
jgi:anaerobic selenocysteine-containing dehydrogenase